MGYRTNSGGSHSTKIVTIFASAARTATANGSVATTSGRSLPITEDNVGFTRHAMVFLDITAVSGTSPTLDFTLEGRTSGSDAWMTLTASSAWTQATAAGEQVRRYEGPLPPEIRGVATIGGTTPSFTFSVRAVLGG